MDEMKKMVDELESLVNAPKGYMDFMPHERLIASALTQLAIAMELTDRDLISAMKRIIVFLEQHTSTREGMK